MTRAGYTHLGLVVDRSGSMAGTSAEAEAGVNHLLEEQAAEPGELTVTLVEFDNVVDVLHRRAAPAEVGAYRHVPRGMTALFDAVGSTVALIGEELSALPEGDRPERVLVAVVTDGLENSSHDWTAGDLRALIARQRREWRWEFVYLGADESAWGADAVGLRGTPYRGDPVGTQSAYASLSAATSRARAGAPFRVTEDDVRGGP